jgi:hypothetical protein
MVMMIQKEGPQRDNTFLYLRGIRQPTAIRGLADLPGYKAMKSHCPTFPRSRVGQARVKAESSWRTGVGLYV